MNEALGTITGIEEVSDIKLAPTAAGDGTGGRLGLAQMINSVIGGYSSMDGYRITTDQHTFHVLIDNAQSCCESWGYLSSDDDLSGFIGAILKQINLTDTALNAEAVEQSDWYDGDDCGIQFVDFMTDRGVFQLAVYNAHNGYYGHGILVAKDDDIVLSDVL